MRYEFKLITRIGLALILVLLPIDIFYLLLLKPTLYAASIFLGGYNPIILEDSLVINNAVLKFIPACIASLAYLLLLLLILTTKDIEIRKRIRLFFIGSSIIFMANIIRIDALIYVYFEYGNEMFNMLHLFIWDLLSSVFVAFLWIALVKIYGIKSMPVYDDLKTLYKQARNN